MGKEDDQKQQLLQSDDTDKAGTAAGATQPSVYSKLNGKGSSPPEALNRDSVSSEKATRKWGTKVMGAPAAPSAHSQNQEAATWTATKDLTPNSYIVQPSPVRHSKCPMNSVLHCFNKWIKKAENSASEVWNNLKTGNSMSDAAWGKVTLGAKALTEGGFEALFRHMFSVSPEEKLSVDFHRPRCGNSVYLHREDRFLQRSALVVHHSLRRGVVELLQGCDPVGECAGCQSVYEQRESCSKVYSDRHGGRPRFLDDGIR